MARIAQLWSHHQIRYLIVAGVTASGYVSLVALGLWLGLHYFVAILIAQAITISLAFPAYRTLVFQSRGTLWADFARFLSVWVSGAFAGLIGTPLLVELLRWDPLISQILAIIVVAVGSYLGHRFFSFKHTTSTS